MVEEEQAVMNPLKKLISKVTASEAVLFMREVARAPGKVGAPLPSSKVLADAIAKQIPLDKDGYVVEIGAGTGVVTEAILEHGVSKEKLIAIERSESMAKHLQQRMPDINVIHADATELDKILGDKAAKVATIVSGVPLRSLSTDIVKAIIEQYYNVLPDDGRLIQFTYSWRNSFPHLTNKHFTHDYSKYVWINVPPARVDVYKKQHA